MSERNKSAAKPPAAAPAVPAEAPTTKRKRKAKSKPVPQKNPPQMLPPWKVLLHNDDVNSHDHVIKTIVELTHINKQDATVRTEEADKTGVALLLTTHKERAELYKDQFTSKQLTVTIEPAE